MSGPEPAYKYSQIVRKPWGYTSHPISWRRRLEWRWYELKIWLGMKPCGCWGECDCDRLGRDEDE